MNYGKLAVHFLTFWFFESPLEMLRYFASLNIAFLHFFSLPLFLQTYFKPLKNEYRPGLVGFSRAMGIVVKTVFIIVDTVLFTLLLAGEVVVFISYIFFPIATVMVLFL